MKATDAAFEVLQQAGEPLHFREITRRMLVQELWITDGRTPEQTVNGRIGDEIRALGTEARFVRLGSGQYDLNSQLSPTSLVPARPRAPEHDAPNTFLVQVSRDRGFSNIVNSKFYENDRWMDKPRDRDHGEVKSGDQLLVYCTRSVPNHSMTLAFRVTVKAVGDDHVQFELSEPDFFQSPLSRNSIHELVESESLPIVFGNCGKQGFNITKLDSASTDAVLARLEASSPDLPAVSTTNDLRRERHRRYTIDDIIGDGCFLDRASLSAILDRLENRLNLILQGPPGTGKTWLAKRLAFALIGHESISQVCPLQFHPNLSYEDFVRGWRPSSNGRLDLVDGPFLEAISYAKRNPSRKHVVVIEEINRGNPAQIFGEMLTLLEADKRIPSEGLALSYPRDRDERVYIPRNLYVIGTMNVADRSLALVDFALRRRFAFVDLKPHFGERWRSWVSEHCRIDMAFLIQVEKRLNALNQSISEESSLGTRYQVGHSVVTPPDGSNVTDPLEWFRQVVETEIVPLLKEYWFDEPDKVRSEEQKLLQGLEA